MEWKAYHNTIPPAHALYPWDAGRLPISVSFLFFPSRLCSARPRCRRSGRGPNISRRHARGVASSAQSYVVIGLQRSTRAKVPAFPRQTARFQSLSTCTCSAYVFRFFNMHMAWYVGGPRVGHWPARGLARFMYSGRNVADGSDSDKSAGGCPAALKQRAAGHSRRFAAHSNKTGCHQLHVGSGRAAASRAGPGGGLVVASRSTLREVTTKYLVNFPRVIVSSNESDRQLTCSLCEKARENSADTHNGGL